MFCLNFRCKLSFPQFDFTLKKKKSQIRPTFRLINNREKKKITKRKNHLSLHCGFLNLALH